MKLKALSNIRHNGARYVADDTLEVTEQEAKALIDAGVAEKVTSKKEEDTQPEKKSLDKMNKTELLAEAEARGVEVSEEDTKDDIIEKLEEK